MDFLRDLPRDLVLIHILGRLDFTSRVRVRAVCRAWREHFPLHVPDTPWLWLTNFSDGRTGNPNGPAVAARLNSARTHSLLNLSSSTTLRPRRCPASVRKAFGSRRQYLTLEMEMERTKKKKQQQRGRCYTIYDPFTGHTFQLPPTFLNVHGRRYPVELRTSAQLSSKPPNCVVVARDCSRGYLYVCRPGDRNWVKGPCACTHSRNYSSWDMIFYKGELYCIEGEEIVVYIDIQHVHNFSSAPLRHVVIDLKDVLCDCIDTDWKRRELFLVESGDGELLLVAKYASYRFDADNKFAFTVHRVDHAEGRLVQVDDLGERMLFVQEGCSQSWPGPLLTSDGFFTNNCIYFFDHLRKRERVKCLLGKFRLNGGELGTSVIEFHSAYGFDNMPLWINTPTHPN